MTEIGNMLYIIATPIGNLDDITLRALGLLKSIDLIIAENPSHSKKLLNHFGIEGKKMIQFAEHNEKTSLPGLITRLAMGDACLITDAGTPGISDPGFRLVRAAVENGIAVSSIPGPSAAITALSASGLPTDKFLFAGFLPKTEPKLFSLLLEAKDSGATLVAYESPQRLKKTVLAISEAYPEAQVVIARELTKIYEEFIRGNASEVLEQLSKRQNIKGEVTLLVSFK